MSSVTLIAILSVVSDVDYCLHRWLNCSAIFLQRIVDILEKGLSPLKSILVFSCNYVCI